MSAADPSVVGDRPAAPVPLRIAAVLTVALLLGILWWRTGTVPAASGGDEVWWSESAYHFLHGGKLRWAFIPDGRGSDQLSFWPPITPLLQALSIKLCGLTAFGIQAQSSLVATLLMAGIFGVCRTAGLDRTRSLFAAAAIWGLLMVQRRLSQVRMENLTALTTVTYAWLILAGARATGRAKQGLLLLGGGVALGVGMFCYYPQSPFLLLAAGGALVAIDRRQRVRAAALVAMGALPAGIAGLWWIGPHWRLFRSQVLLTGTEHYLSPANLLLPFKRLLVPGSPADWLQHVEQAAVLALGIAMLLTARRRELRALAWMTASASLPMFFYDVSPQVSAGVLAVIILAVISWHGPNRRAKVSSVAVLACLVAAAVGMFAVIAFTAVYQREGRNYAPVARQLRAAVSPDQRIAISQRAWLGLREVIPADRLQYLVPDRSSLELRPLMARSATAVDYYDILILERLKLPALRDLYPWLGPALDSGQFRLIKEIRPMFAPLPWARTPSYDLLVFARNHVAAP